MQDIVAAIGLDESSVPATPFCLSRASSVAPVALPVSNRTWTITLLASSRSRTPGMCGVPELPHMRLVMGALCPSVSLIS